MTQKEKSSKKKLTKELPLGPLSSRANIYIALGNLQRLQILELCANRPMTQALIDRHIGGNMKYNVAILQDAKLLLRQAGEVYIVNKTNMAINNIIHAVCLLDQ
jgi:hypothetical protein